MREQGVTSLEDVEAAVMETNGSLTIRVRNSDNKRALLPLVSDGHLVPNGLTLAGKDKAWVKEQLAEQGYSSVKQIFLAQLVHENLEMIPFPTYRRKKR